MSTRLNYYEVKSMKLSYHKINNSSIELKKGVNLLYEQQIDTLYIFYNIFSLKTEPGCSSRISIL